ncbi:MAG: DUF1553 domain-containing protein [Phycisphaera sp.]|nr:DUF1553 domain-containing protein [Phycisphaera sp.]
MMTKRSVPVVVAASLTLMIAPAVRAGLEGGQGAGGVKSIEFNRDIRPILSNYCFHCHGPSAHDRKAKLRLDTMDGAYKDLGGYAAVVPGKPADSELIARITAKNPDDLMPPPKEKKTMKPEEIELLRQWIKRGGQYEGHWAFVAPTADELPKVSNAAWAKTPIDRYIMARLDAEGLTPSEQADRHTLVRRVTFDLTGLPPTPEEVEAFVKDKSPNAYEKLVDRLLASPRFGEHVGRYWLDAVRYGDTHGLHLDNYREMWPYRDWVINAFNANMPFDQFVTEQLAGDLLPNPTRDQLVASGFNRCNITTSEGGSIAEEVYVRNVVDRVDTYGTIFMGMTVGCSRCHDHKFDPFTMKDYYSLFAFFNNLDANPLDGNKKDHPPVIKVPTPEQQQQLDDTQAELSRIDEEIKQKLAAVKYTEPANPTEVTVPQPTEMVWIDDDTPAGANLQGNTPWKFITKTDGPVFSGEKASTRTAKGLSQHFFTDAKEPLTLGKGDTLFAYVYLDPKDPPKEIMLQWNDGKWEHRAYWGGNVIPWGGDKSPSRLPMGELPKTGKWVRLEVDAQKVGLNPGAKVNGWAFTQHDGTVYWDKAGIITTPAHPQKFDSLAMWQKYFRGLDKPVLPKDIDAIVKLEDDKRTPEQVKKMTEYFVENVWTETSDEFQKMHAKRDQLEKKTDGIEKGFATTLIFKERKDIKDAFMLERGEYDKKGEKVDRQTPAFLPPMNPNLPHDRLGLAKWTTDPANPLTARVTVNRFWQQCFGVGIVKTSEDFGSQGQWPSHPELLDYLAVSFVKSGWDVKALLKSIVMSATYQQASKATPSLLAKDPENRLLARGPRFRLDAEMLRDQALALSGLLVEKMGGPSVKPPQPSGLWQAVGYSSSNTAHFKADTGDDKVHRRSVYTFWKRTSPPPQMTTFDAPDRESCTVRRERTNTPLQALLLMNDPQFVEASRAFAERVMHEVGDDPVARAAHMFHLATARQPSAIELETLVATYRDHLATYTRDIEGAAKLVTVGESKSDEKLDVSQLAAWTMVANLVLNLDEVLNKG